MQKSAMANDNRSLDLISCCIGICNTAVSFNSRCSISSQCNAFILYFTFAISPRHCVLAASNNDRNFDLISTCINAQHMKSILASSSQICPLGEPPQQKKIELNIFLDSHAEPCHGPLGRARTLCNTYSILWQYLNCSSRGGESKIVQQVSQNLT